MQTKENNKNVKIISVLFFVLCFLLSIEFKAQCAMCRASLESTGNVEQAQAVNDGIVYLMAIPYILVGLASYYVYKMYKKKKS
ncbi:hypothetical protein [Flavobacterium columnare]|uniref:Uncharacterized protein n=2 Tax=Flavobacterium TaxID=237 RepID=A0A2N9P706_9FLAO|nr:hypothetical protein [Flavobacterium columnare]RVU91281.1 hypothetical protein EH230_10425 [Flavobacterium columnare]SPE76109.1 hypothetical protein FLACOL_00087 [Flavobacterium columnare]